MLAVLLTLSVDFEREALSTTGAVIGTSFMESVGDQDFDEGFPLEAISDHALDDDRALTEVKGRCIVEFCAPRSEASFKACSIIQSI